MTGIAVGASTAIGQQVFSVGVGEASGTYGYSATLGIGTISPASYKGNTVTAVISTSGPSFRLSIQGSHTSLFSQIIIQRTDGTLQTLLASNAIRSGTTTTSWEWSVASLPWDSTSPTPRLLSIYG